MQINYGRPKLDLFQNMAFVLMQQTSTPNILRDAGLCFKPSPGWPSWIPDWSTPKRSSALSTKDCGRAACANTYGNFGVQTTELRANGIKIDTVLADGLGESSGSESTAEASDFRSMSSFIESWAKFLDLPQPRSDQPRYVTGVSVCEAFHRTVAVNINYIAQVDSYTERPLEREDIQQDLDIDSWTELGVKSTAKQIDGPVQLADRVPSAGTNRLFRSSKGYFGNGTKYIEPNDEIFVVQGSKFPLVLRPVEQNDHELPSYRLVEVCYVHGIMQGEAFDQDLLRESRVV